MTKICLTGGTGGLGSRVLYHLLYTLHIAPEDLIISLHNPSNLPGKYIKLRLEVRHGDFQSPESLEEAFRGAEKLFLVSYPSLRHQVRVDAHKNAINAALAVGVKHIYYTFLAVGDESKAAVKQAHIDTRTMSVHESIYSESVPLYLGYLDRMKAEHDRVIRVPSIGGLEIAWVAKDEFGEGTARIITSYFDPEGTSWTNRKVLLSDKVLVWQDRPLSVVDTGAEGFLDYHADAETGPKSKEYDGTWATA